MIKFKSIFIILGFFISYYFQGQNISEETARIVAKNFISQKSEIKRSQEVQLTNITAQIDKKYNGFYIFKTANGQGFCIISSEKENHPVLAYSFDSTFSTEEPISPEFLYILNEFQAANEYLRKNKSKKIINEEDHVLIIKEWEALLDGKTLPSTKKAKLSYPENVEPLLETTWKQSPYYNKFVPLTYEDKSCPTGCVATAMAQIMKYWNYPVKGNGTYTYTIDNSKYDWKGKTLTADFENATYLWDTMPNSLSSSSTDAEIDAVATLMLHAGISVEMTYGPNGSGAYSKKVPFALINYFKYSSDIDIEYRSDYASDIKWINLVKDQLAKGYPVYFSGRSSSGGHAFIADGYDANNLIHFNFGWGGSSNGYYQITNPKGYTGRQAVIINIYPSSYTCSKPTALSTSNITDINAVLSWKAVDGAQNYTVEYKTASASTWTIANAATNSTTLTLSGLIANTAYNWRVRSNCLDSNTSLYSQANFNTIPAQAPCIASYEPNDSFAQATSIHSNIEYSAGIGSASDKDYYKFILNSKSSITVTLQNLFKDYNFIVYNSSYKRIGKSTRKKKLNKSVFSKTLKPDTYYVQVYDKKGNFDVNQCYTLKVEGNYITYKNINISDTLIDNEIPNTKNNNPVILYPNPVEDIINIKGIYSDKKEYANLTIYDRNGRIVKSFSIRLENIISINVSDLSPNLYFLRIKGKNYKFIKK
ncbi:C10 family peptidase [Apibacter adventoris]|uniref:Fibronectin type-III domain-containing protein n=1 Tax=Apibacter adventoris TaxID=1679466 RepID=A0A2S8AEM9_9FLAO|nr:C10 family peptidase [Apibacter adventoris]PQL93970.1 hypothetical protein C4S77_04080 [Apibacter adventoris]